MNLDIKLWNKIKVILTIGLSIIMLIMFQYVKGFKDFDIYMIVSLVIIAFILYHYYVMHKCYKIFENEKYIKINNRFKLNVIAMLGCFYIIFLLSFFEFNMILICIIKIAIYSLVMLEPGYYDVKDFNKYKGSTATCYIYKIIFCQDYAFISNVFLYAICLCSVATGAFIWGAAISIPTLYASCACDNFEKSLDIKILYGRHAGETLTEKSYENIQIDE